MLAISFLLACVSIVLLVVAQLQLARLRQLRAAQRSTTRELAAYAESVSQALVEAGNYSQVAEVTGVIRCDSPLTSEIAKQPCVYYDAKVWREYEETGRWSSRRARRRSARARRGSEVVSSNSQRVPFWVEDAVGRILVDPTDAEVEPIQIVDRFESAEAAAGSGTLKIGSFSITVSGLPFGSEPSRRTSVGRYEVSRGPVGRCCSSGRRLRSGSGTVPAVR